MLWVLFTLIYVQTGYQLGKKAGKVWKEGDSESLESFLFFPVSHARGKVGDPDAPLVGPIHEGDVLYRTLITLGWPVMAAWNLLLIGGLLGPDKVIRRLTGQHKADRFKALESRLIKEEKKVDRVIRKLEAPRRQRKPREPKQPKALPAAVPAQAVSGPGSAEAAFFKERLLEPQAEQADPPPSPVQVRVTVDVTAPGAAAEEPASRDGRPAHEDAPAASAHRGGRQDIVH